MKYLIAIFLCSMTILSGIAMATDTSTASSGFFDSIWDWSKDSYSWISKNIGMQSIFNIANAVFDLGDSSTFKLLSGSAPGIGIGGFEFKFPGWTSSPSVAYHDEYTGARMGWTGSVFGVESGSSSMSWDPNSGNVRTVGIGPGTYNSQNGFSSYLQPNNAPAFVSYVIGKGWVDSSGNTVSNYNFGYMPGNIPFQFGNDPNQNADASRRLGANMQMQSFLAQQSTRNIAQNPSASLNDIMLAEQINGLLNQGVLEVQSHETGGAMSAADANGVRTFSTGVETKTTDLLMAMSRDLRPIQEGDTCQGVCLKTACQTSAEGNCLSGYTCCDSSAAADLLGNPAVLATGKYVDETCTRNEECLSGLCDMGRCKIPGLTGANSVTGLPNGMPCVGNSDCSSGFCNPLNNLCG